LLLALEATEPVSELVTQVALELIKNHVSTVKEISVKATFFHVTTKVIHPKYYKHLKKAAQHNHLGK
jgi:hypothetical protein